MFAGFGDPWLDEHWYIVKIDKGPFGHRIKFRVDLPPCQVSYLNNDSIFSQPDNHPC